MQRWWRACCHRRQLPMRRPSLGGLPLVSPWTRSTTCPHRPRAVARSSTPGECSEVLFCVFIHVILVGGVVKSGRPVSAHPHIQTSLASPFKLFQMCAVPAASWSPPWMVASCAPTRWTTACALGMPPTCPLSGACSSAASREEGEECSCACACCTRTHTTLPLL